MYWLGHSERTGNGPHSALVSPLVLLLTQPGISMPAAQFPRSWHSLSGLGTARTFLLVSEPRSSVLADEKGQDKPWHWGEEGSGGMARALSSATAPLFVCLQK